MLLFVRRMLLLMFPDPKGEGGGDPKPEEKEKEKKPEPSNLELAKALKELKENSVSKEDYEKLQNENKELIAQVINGDGGSGNGQPTPEKADIKSLREELYGPKGADLSNLDFWKKTLELREAVIEQEGYDPFLPHGAKIKPNEQDVERANAVAKTVQECIDKSEGSSEVFTALLQQETANDSPSFLAHLKKIGALK
ncbi:MAG: hypothetical protein J6V44_01720 [Methanobrevibacter sp.]|nr:hypothetical protein [Methanobrevibacter sp.]